LDQADWKKGMLTVIVVSFNDRPHLEACLTSLERACDGLETEIIVVDNHSTDGSPEMIESSFPRIRLIRAGENLGYSRANNIGIREAKGEFLLFLNTDTVVPPAAVSTLLAELNSRPAVGAIAPALRRRSGYQVSFGQQVSFFAELWQKFFRNPYFGIVLPLLRQPRSAGWLSGACLLARRKAIEEAGLFDENFFLFFEDIDLCRRMSEKGYRLLFFPRIRVFHEGGAVTSRMKWRSRLEYRRSQLYYYQKHASQVSVVLLSGYLRLSFFLRRIFCFRPADECREIRERMRFVFLGSSQRADGKDQHL